MTAVHLITNVVVVTVLTCGSHRTVCCQCFGSQYN